MRNSRRSEKYIAPLKYGWLTGLYDPLLRWTVRESTFKGHLVEQADLERGHRVLDVGCGTATLALLVKRACPQAEVVGLDGDSKVLEIARRKAANEKLKVTLDQGMSFELPYPNDFFDHVFSSLLFHHLTRENKVLTLAEVFRVLRPGGELHVADWGEAQNGAMRMAFLVVQILDGFDTTADNVKGLLPEFFPNAGFERIQIFAQYTTIFGSLCLYRARKP